MSENILTNSLRYGASPGIAIGNQGPWDATPTEAQLAEMKKRQAWNEKRNLAFSIMGVAEQLVVNHNLSVATAFETAQLLAAEAQAFVEKFAPEI